MNTSTDSIPLTTNELSASQKGFTTLFIILGIILVVGIAGGAYYFDKTQIPKTQPQNPVITSQTPQPTAISQTIPSPSPTLTDETANWKTYRNSYFSFKYPSSWIQKDIKNPNSKTELANISLTKKIPGTEEDIEMIFLARTHTEKPEFIISSFSNKRNIVINGVNGIRSSGSGGEGGAVYKIVVELTRDNAEYHILGNNYNGPDFSEFDQILSTFKFIQ